MRCVFLLTAALAPNAMALPATAESIASDRGLDGFVKVERLPVPEDPVLAAGRLIWGGTCQNCHGGNKLTGAPKITSTRAWAPRIAQGMGVLVTHANEGFIGPKYAQMPAKGGDPDLSDEAVKAAVAFMVWASGGEARALDYATTNINMDKIK